ncbi:MAG TPA: BCAM0308 family protein [Chitinivibrionales bacterium]|nr:BCAM0308 family protein [Chitinivibrionales bacterium]
MNKTMGTRRVFPERQDEYEAREKYPEPAVCPECGDVFRNGRWTGRKMFPSGDLYLAKCPACSRKDGNRPAGDIKISGPFFQAHQAEILNRIRRIERKERGTHPLEQIIAMHSEPDYADISTSGIHLARRIGDALRHSFKGDLSYSYGKGEKSIRVIWARN